ncbi:MAG: DinB family protein [Planctomycetota bacterium]
MRAIDAFLLQLDGAWDHAWESLRSALDGITDEEATWQAPCYRGEESAPGMPLAGTVHWHVAHLADCKDYYSACLRHRGKEGAVECEPLKPRASFAESLEQLKQVHEAQRELVASLQDEDLALTVENGVRVSEYLATTLRHDAWHAAQIAVARRLWRTRD